MRKGIDSGKDQSYFLYRLERELLDFIDFHNIPYEERDNGKLFTLSGAHSIVQALLEDGESERHQFLLDCLVQDVRCGSANGGSRAGAF